MQKTMYPAQANSLQTELAVEIDTVQTTILLVNASVVPDAPNLLTIGTDESAETILYTGKTGNNLTGVTRGFQGASKSWVVGTKVARYFTAYDADTIRENIIDNTQDIAKLSDPPRAKYYIPDKVAANSAWTKLGFGAKVFDSNYFISTDFSKLTIKEAGTYILNAYIMFSSGAIGLRNIRVSKNGVDIAYQAGYANEVMNYRSQITSINHFDVDDVIEIFVYHNAGADLTITLADGQGSGISIVKVAEHL